jgi:hypothetical protein
VPRMLAQLKESPRASLLLPVVWYGRFRAPGMCWKDDKMPQLWQPHHRASASGDAEPSSADRCRQNCPWQGDLTHANQCKSSEGVTETCKETGGETDDQDARSRAIRAAVAERTDEGLQAGLALYGGRYRRRCHPFRVRCGRRIRHRGLPVPRRSEPEWHSG